MSTSPLAPGTLVVWPWADACCPPLTLYRIAAPSEYPTWLYVGGESLWLVPVDGIPDAAERGQLVRREFLLETANLGIVVTAGPHYFLHVVV